MDSSTHVGNTLLGYFEQLCDLILQFPTLVENSKFLLIPGPTDPSLGGKVLPAAPLADIFTRKLKVRDAALFLSHGYCLPLCMLISSDASPMGVPPHSARPRHSTAPIPAPPAPPWHGSDVFPIARAHLPPAVQEKLGSSVIFGSNPSRVLYYTQELVFFRHDLLHLVHQPARSHYRAAHCCRSPLHTQYAGKKI